MQTNQWLWQGTMMASKSKALDTLSPINAVSEKIEKLKASVTAKVEHPFRFIKCQFSYRKTRYKGLVKHAMRKNQFLIPLLFLLASCSGVHPFSKTTSKEADEILTYYCENDISFRIQILNKGQDVWLIYPDHEVNLSRVDPKDNRYTSGVITLVLDASNTTLTDGDQIVYQKCQIRH